MEFLNKVELKGVVGRTYSKEYVPNKTCHNFSLVTEHANKEQNTIEVTWWNCLAWSDKTPNVTKVEKGDKVHLIGRLRQRKYIDQDQREIHTYDVVVQSVEKIEE